jgi:hypothetical protein
MGFQSNRAPTPRPFVSRRAEGNPDLQFSFSSFYFLIRNNGRNKNAAGKSASPPYRGGRSAEGACECASRDRSRCAGGWINGSRADDNLHYDFRKLFKKTPVIMVIISRPFRFSRLPPLTMGGKQGVSAAELINDETERKKRGGLEGGIRKLFVDDHTPYVPRFLGDIARPLSADSLCSFHSLLRVPTTKIPSGRKTL